MPTADFSIAPPSFVQFSFDGWEECDKVSLEAEARQAFGVTKVNQAGAGDSLHVHFDQSQIDRDDLILAIARIADRIVPGHNFSA